MSLDYATAKSLCASARDPQRGKPIANNTRVVERPNGGKPNYAVRFHQTDILTFHADGSFTVDAGGWHTITTVMRMNDYLPSGCRVGSVKGRLHLFKRVPDKPIVTTRRRRTYRQVEKFYTHSIWGEVPDPDICVCGAHSRDHRLAHYRHPNGGEPGPCRAESYMHAGRHPWGHGCDCPGFLANPRATKRGVIGEERASYMDRVPDGWEQYQDENPWHDLGELGPITVRKNGKVVGKKSGPREVKKPVLGWHCIDESRQMANMRRAVIILPGKTYQVNGEPVLCSNGLHASRRLRDALTYHDGPIVCRVELSGRIDRGSEFEDKMCATRRKVLWMVDIRELGDKWRRLTPLGLERAVSKLSRIER